MTATPTHTQIQPCWFLDDGVFATKAGEAGMVIQLRPHDSECMDTSEIEATAAAFGAAVRMLGEGYRLYQYLLKRRVLLIESQDRARASYLSSKTLFSYRHYIVILADRLDKDAIRRVAESFVIRLGDAVPASLMDKNAVFGLFRELLNYDPETAAAVRLKYDKHLDYYAADSSIDAHREFLRVGDYYVKVLTLKDPPLASHPDMLRRLREIPCECVVVTEWTPREMETIRKTIRSKIGHFHRSKYALNIFGAIVSKFSKQESERPEDMEKDDSATAMEQQLGSLMVDIERNGTTVGEFALTVIVFARDRGQVDKAASLASKALTDEEASLYAETYNALSAWFAALPGGHKHQLRAMYLTDANYCDLSMLFSPAVGEPVNPHLGAQCLSLLETRQNTIYHANLHYQDVGHALFSGMTGSGKSYLANHLVRNAVSLYGARVIIFDIGGSYQQLTREIGGAYLEIGIEHDFTINPFALAPSKETRNFLFLFLKVLIESSEYRMTGHDQDVLHRALAEPAAQLGKFAERLPDTLSVHLSRWIGDGQYGSVFDNAKDTLTYANFQTFEFEGLERYPQILEPLLFYVLHRASADIYDSSKRDQFKLFLLDEAWKFLLNPTVKAYIYESLKTWRKRNAAMWLATQSLTDLGQKEMLAAVAETCGWLVLLPNPRMDREHYRTVFKLNDTELDLVLSMTPKAESLWKPAVGASKVVVLDLEKAPKKEGVKTT